jgi:hypothetical protein
MCGGSLVEHAVCGDCLDDEIESAESERLQELIEAIQDVERGILSFDELMYLTRPKQRAPREAFE